MATSFISEHSAEFVLVPIMKALLEERFSIVVPIFPWLSREFGNQAKSSHGFSGFHVLALFPRRPKVSDEGDVLVTINGELSVYKEIALKHGITVLAGCPNATNLRELATCDECAWIDIDGYYDYLENINCLGGKRLTDKDVIACVSRGEVHTMESLEEFIRETRYVLPAGFFGMRYKPIYFLVEEH
ncbi:hypothetical protein K0I73_15540 [Shewanella mesophila]|uniref:hypothetical protein n=1 Tax=Shewanella mesophila TaxID=2864208 RepID=UPI001C65C513|nr:hypothetical protein [Shewanella mesophila]QYJ85585.1 hypothetical protein K0I73_15540 [Shewanella mesophila]